MNQKPTKESQTWFWVSVSCGLYWLAHSTTRPMIALYALELGCDAVTIGIILAVFSLFPFLLAIPGGGMADFLGYENVLRFGAGLMVLSGLVYMISGQVWLLLIAQIIAGIGQMLVWLCTQTMITQQENKATQDNKIATFALYMSIGQLLGPFLGGYISEHFGYFFVFLVYTLASCALVFSSWQCEVGIGTSLQHSHSSTLNVGQMYINSWGLLKNKGFIATLLCTFIALFIIDVRSSFLPVYLENLQLSNTTIGLMISLGALSALFVKPLYPFLVRRLDYGKLLAGTFIFGLSLVIVTPFLKNVLGFVLLIFISGLALGINQPLSLSMIAQQTSYEERGLGVGLRLMANRLALVLNPVMFGIFMSWVGLKESFWLVGGILFVLCAWTIWLWFFSTRHHPEFVMRGSAYAGKGEFVKR